MRVIMTGGGTGGHIYPAIAIADKIMEKTHNGEVLFVGTERGLESQLVPKHGYDIKYITVSGLNRKKLLKNIKVLRDYNKGKKEARAIIEEFKPDVVIGTGGYVSGPVVKVATEMNIKCYIQEQNAFPGITNRMLEKKVENLFLGFEDGGKFFKTPEKHVVTGNPVRSEFFNIKKDEAREKLNIDENDFVILAFGGSQGAGRINKAMLQVIEKYHEDKKVKIFFGTGSFYYDPILAEMEEMELRTSDNVQVIEYIEDMEVYLGAADLVISRSGALTVSEIAVCGKAAILIPSPNVTGNHQTYNAKAIADKGGAILLEEEKLNGDTLIAAVESLKDDRKALKAMEENCAKCAPVDAADIIYYTLIT